MHFRRQLAAPGELGLVQGRGVWGPYLSLSLSLLHANLWSRLPATAAPAIAFPRLAPPIPFYGHSCSLFPPPSSSFMIPEWLPMALRVVSSLSGSGRQLFYISGVFGQHLPPHDNNTSDPMTACMHLISCCWQSNIWPSQRHLVGAKAHWRSPSLLAEALTPCHPGTPYLPTPYHGSQKTKFNHCRTCNSCAEQPKVSVGRCALRSW